MMWGLIEKGNTGMLNYMKEEGIDVRKHRIEIFKRPYKEGCRHYGNRERPYPDEGLGDIGLDGMRRNHFYDRPGEKRNKRRKSLCHRSLTKKIAMHAESVLIYVLQTSLKL
jgi:hypothetical protein